MRSPQRQPANKCKTSFSALQERAKQYFNDTNSSENISQMLQLIEDFCREGDKLIEEEKETKKDLQEQVINNIHEMQNTILNRSSKSHSHCAYCM